MKYTNLIQDYCDSKGIDVPVGFHRRAASRYAVIDRTTEQPKLVARTWFKMADVVYYLRIEADRTFTILDFKEGIELIDVGQNRLKRGEPIG